MSMVREREIFDVWQTGADTLAGRFLRRFWYPIYRAQDLAAGRAVPLEVLSEKFTLYRGEGGAAHIVGFRCAHRGTQLSSGWVEDDCLRCLYHGWKYDASGQCVEQPGEDAGFASKIRIATYPTQEYLGLVFGWFGEGTPPPLQQHPDFEEEGIIDLELPEFWPCNFFNRVDNACDIGHVAFTHFEAINREREASGRQRDYGRTWECEETGYGIKTQVNVPGRPPEYFHYHMPVANQNSEGASLHRGGLDRQGSRNRRISWRVPVNERNTVSFSVNLLQLTQSDYEQYKERRQQVANVSPEAFGAEILAGKLRERELGSDVPRPALFSVEDYVTQVGQGPVAPREQDHLGKIDHGVILLRRIWERELRAMADGRPLKDWTAKAPGD